MAKVAVVILNWNGKKHLQRFLPSVLEHSSSAEVYVADNGSTDDSVEFVRKNFPQVKLVLLDKNYGFAGGYNKALKQIEADYYVLLNSDVEIKDKWIEPVIGFMEQNPDVAAVQPKILSYKDPQYFEYAGAAGGFIDKWGYPFARGRIFDVVEQDHGQYDDICEIFWASGAAMFVRAKDYWLVGGLDEDFFAHQEEIDMCWRLKNRGKKIFAYPRVAVYHLGGGSLSYQNPRKVYFNFRNNLMMLLKNLPRGKAFSVIFLRLFLDAAAAFQMLLGKPKAGFWNVIKAHFSFYANLPKTLKKRRQLVKYNRFDYPQVYRKSLIWQFFVKKKRYFSQLFDQNSAYAQKQ